MQSKAKVLQRYMDSPPNKNKKKQQSSQQSQVVYRKIQIVDNDNIDQLMGRLVDNDQEDDLKPVFVETIESKNINATDKKKVLERIMKENQQKKKSRSRSRSSDSSSDSSDSSDSSSSSSSDLSVERKNQQTVYRDSKTGQQISQEEKVKQEQQFIEQKTGKLSKETIQKAMEQNIQQINKWGRGLVQDQEQEDQQRELQNYDEKNEERERDLYLIRQEQFHDPMRKILQQDHQAKLQTSKTVLPRRKRCKFPTIPNRYGIEAGHRWDGVDRSNGYERKYLSIQNERKDTQLRQHQEYLKQL